MVVVVVLLQLVVVVVVFCMCFWSFGGNFLRFLLGLESGGVEISSKRSISRTDSNVA